MAGRSGLHSIDLAPDGALYLGLFSAKGALGKPGSHPSQCQHAYLLLASQPRSYRHLGFFLPIFSAPSPSPVETLLACDGS